MSRMWLYDYSWALRLKIWSRSFLKCTAGCTICSQEPLLTVLKEAFRNRYIAMYTVGRTIILCWPLSRCVTKPLMLSINKEMQHLSLCLVRLLIACAQSLFHMYPHCSWGGSLIWLKYVEGCWEEALLLLFTLELDKSFKLSLHSFSLYAVVVTIDKTSEINFALLKAPVFTTTYVETDHKVWMATSQIFGMALRYMLLFHSGRILLHCQSSGVPLHAPHSPVTLWLIQDDVCVADWLCCWLSRLCLSASRHPELQCYSRYGLFTQLLLVFVSIIVTWYILLYVIVSIQVPKDLPLQLNTESFKLIVPAVSTATANVFARTTYV